MSNEFDIDAPADMELLGGTFDDKQANSEAEAKGAAASEADQVGGAAEAGAEEAGAAANDQEPEPTNKRDPVIPRARFDEVNAKLHAERQEREALQAEVDRLRQEQQAPAFANTSVSDLEQQFFDALMEGEKEKAVEIRARINADIEARAEARAAERATQAMSEREQTAALNSVVERSVKAYPFLDTNSDQSNPQAIADVVEWRDFYMAKGESAASALARAVDRVAPSYVAEEPATAKQPVTDKRQQAAVVNGAKAAASQPPRVDAGVGNRAIPSGDSIVGNQAKWEKASDEERMRYLM
jgi:hypothetical protein